MQSGSSKDIATFFLCQQGYDLFEKGDNLNILPLMTHALVLICDSLINRLTFLR